MRMSSFILYVDSKTAIYSMEVRLMSGMSYTATGFRKEVSQWVELMELLR